ncbi:hypothetical protein AeRB84_003610 [Aphanomyces euteiches]|nr:hypothetical protein AeRB84_003610 [Aphanomyces euteiches]
MYLLWQNDDELRQLVLNRWDFLRTESMAVAFLLDPSSNGGRDMLFDDQLGAVLQVQVIATSKGLTTTAESVGLELDSYFSIFDGTQPKLFELIHHVNYNTFWMTYGRKHFPILHQVALLVNAIPTSQAASERVWSVYDYVHAKRRNRLSHEKATKLVKLYVNAKTKLNEADMIAIMQDLDDEYM